MVESLATKYLAAATKPRPWFVLNSARTRRICLLMLAVWIMNIVDLLLTLSAHTQGLLVEVNPIAVAILPHGAVALSIFKILLVLFGTMVFIAYNQRRMIECLSWALAAVYVAVSVQWLFCFKAYEIVVAFRDYGARPDFLGML